MICCFHKYIISMIVIFFTFYFYLLFLFFYLGTLSVWYLYKNNIISSNVEGLKSPKKHKKPNNSSSHTSSSSSSSSAKKRASFSEKLILMPELKFVFQLSSIDPHGNY